MRIIAYATLRKFGDEHPQVRNSIRLWFRAVRKKDIDWKTPQGVIDAFGEKRVDILKNNRVCIDLAGNKVRLVLKVEYGQGMAFVRWIGWHKDYSRLGEDIHCI